MKKSRKHLWEGGEKVGSAAIKMQGTTGKLGWSTFDGEEEKEKGDHPPRVGRDENDSQNE